MGKSYNRQLVAERLKDLRKQNNKKIPLIKLSEEIEEKTEVYISATQLNKYENPEKSDIMNVKNLIAIADYYDVSYEYLLGKSEAKKRENINIHERTGLSDNAINNIMTYKESFFPVQTNQYGFIPALNKFLENSEFCEFLILLGSYYNNLEEDMKKSDLKTGWKRQEYTDEQKEIFKSLKTLGYNYIARDSDYTPYAYESKPEKYEYDWQSKGDVCIELETSKILNAPHLNFIKWEDEEPFEIPTL